VDQVVLLRFVRPHSFTGEDVVELQAHGSVAVLRSVLALLGDVEGLRPAEAGEFTRRALMNDRLDLAQVEGLSDLLQAETEGQRKQAMAVMQGDLTKLYEGWRTHLVSALARLEASIDFADEDLPVDLAAVVLEELRAVAAGMEIELGGSAAAVRIREGYEVALVGAPNSGKSTLINRLTKKEAALTSAVAGTTRDVIEVRMDLQGLPMTVLDMAGLRNTTDHVERMGVDRARARAEAADLRIFLVEGDEDIATLGVPKAADDIVALSKCDVRAGFSGFGISGLTGEGVEDLLCRIHRVLQQRSAAASLLAHERQRLATRAAVSATLNAITLLERDPERTDIAAAEVREALRDLDGLVGVTGVEEVLSQIFASFCVGK
jgi:tRNA modification GTPase